MTAGEPVGKARRAVAVRRVRAGDMPQVIALDAKVTGLAKAKYWHETFARYGKRRSGERLFLVAEPSEGRARLPVVGFIVGEVRAWEFGSAPCGWVVALSVEPGARLEGIGQALMTAIADEFRRTGVSQMRTMVARDNRLHLMFFRSQGMMAGPYIELEMELD
jgi:GNAT superfamily N-acetyltransferase